MSFRPPRWLRAHGGWQAETDRSAGRRLFHAYDQDNSALCQKNLGLLAGDRPTEGDLNELCPACVAAQRDGPAPISEGTGG